MSTAVSSKPDAPSGFDPRLQAGRGERWQDRYLFWVPRPLRNLGIVAGVLFLLWVVAASGGNWSLLGQQFVAGLSLGTVAALAGMGLVVAYAATGVFNFAFAGI